MSDRPDWHAHAACRDAQHPDDWHPADTTAQAVRLTPGNKAALTLCRTCPAQTHCLDHALEHNEPSGIWGGLTHSQRQVLRAQQGRTEAVTKLVTALDQLDVHPDTSYFKAGVILRSPGVGADQKHVNTAMRLRRQTASSRQ